MKKVPFYGNHPDNMHCALAVYRMLFDFFLDRKLSWEAMEKMSGFQPSRAAWTVTIWERMARQGFDIRMIEPFHYRRYMEEGQDYLKTYFASKQAYEWQIANTNLLDIKPLIPDFLKQVQVEERQATLEDIDDMLEDGRLVFVTLNPRILDDQPGYSDHAVLIIDQDGDEYIMHDPGEQPRPYRRVSRQKLWQAMGAEQTTSEVTGVKFKPRRLRADVILANMYPTYSRAALAKLFKAGQVTYQGRTLKPGDKLPSNVQLEAVMDSLRPPEASDIDLPIIYEDDDILVINKPAGVLTHAVGAFAAEPSVATFIRQRTAGLTGLRAGIVHRLDRATSGVLVCAKNPKALSLLQKQFAQRKVTKTYMAIVKGHLKQPEAIIDMPIERNPQAPATFRVGTNGKPAVTQYKVVEENATHSLLQLTPQTGRTHQLRVHLAQLGHPIVGDPLYSTGKYGDRMYLHALNLELTVPISNERMVFTAPLPAEFKQFMDA